MSKLTLYFVIGFAGLAAQTLQTNNQAPDVDERTLQDKYHIVPTEEGLIGALQHQEAAVRSFAAIKLAYDGDKAAIRPILDAMASEKIPGVKIGLATAAAQLGTDEGLNALKSMCEDRNWSPTARMIAAQSMILNVGRQECLSDILDVLRSADALPEGYPAATIALNLLAYNRFKKIPPSQLDEIRDLCAMYLKNRALGLRMAAGTCIRDQGGPWAISQLRAAIDAEPDEAVRDSLRKDLLSVR